MDIQIKTLEQMRDSRMLYEKKLPAFGYIIIITVTVLFIGIVIWSLRTSKIDMIKANGTVESNNKNYVMSQYTGELLEVAVKEGAQVEKGDVLFRVKSTDLNLQVTQLEEQKRAYEIDIAQYEKLANSIRDDTNYFDASKAEDSLYFSQFEAYKSQVEQNHIDASTYKTYGYTDEQIENELTKNESIITEIYYSSLQAAESAIEEAETQIQTINAQLSALKSGQGEYTITAKNSGVVHMMSDYKTGMVVQAAVPIASIASVRNDYSIVAFAEPSAITRIEIGDRVDIEVAGLPKSIYGTIPGKVISFDIDITTDQNPQNGTSTSYFKVYIKPDQNYLVS